MILSMSNHFWKQVAFEVRRLARLALGLVPPKPKPLILKGTQEHLMASVLRHTIALPPVTAGDEAKRKVHYSVNGGPDTHLEINPDAAGAFPPTFTVDFQAGDAVKMTLSDFDKSGNESPESDPLEFTAADTFPPAKPGSLGVTNVEQIDS